jgi:ATP-dependent exoDNAse (exonuclease V) beta subunit
MGNNSKQDAVTFFDTTHRYFLKKNGKELIAVSKALEVTGIVNFDKVPFEQRERAAFMGECVHETARLYGLNKLDIEQLDPLLIGYYESIKKFYAAQVARILFVEVIVHDERFGYAGTIDIVYQDHKNRVCLDDFKTGEILPGARFQLALYKNAFEKNYSIPVEERATVYLKNDGTFDSERDRVVYRERQDFHDAVTILGTAYIKMKYKITT